MTAVPIISNAVKFPARVTAASPLVLDIAGADYNFSVDVDALSLSITELNGEVSILSFPGVDPTGVLDSSAARDAAQAEVGSWGKIIVPAGTYRFDTPPSGNAFWDIRAGATFTGAYPTLPGVTTKYIGPEIQYSGDFNVLGTMLAGEFDLDGYLRTPGAFSGANDSAKISAAAADAIANGGNVALNSPSYNLSAAAVTGNNVGFEGSLTAITTPANFPSSPDSMQVESQANWWRTVYATKNGTAGMPGTANNFGEFTGMVAEHGANVSCGKWARMTWVHQKQSTDYVTPIYRDAIGHEVYATVDAAVSSARIYAFHAHVRNMNPGAGYFGTGMEIEMQNDGLAQTNWGTQTSNSAVSLIAYGGVTTGAIAINGVLGGTFADGIWINAGTVTNAAFRLASDTAVWKATGQMRIGSGVNAASPIVEAAYVARNWNGYDFLAEKTATGNAAARFEATNAAAEEYITFVYKATKACSIGYDNTGRYFAISGQEGVAGSKYVEWSDAGVGTYHGLSKFADDIWLTNATSNGLYFGNIGLGAPGAASAGQKIQLYGTAGTVGATDFSLGIRAGFMWLNSGGGYEWYVNSVLKATLSSTGDFTPTGKIFPTEIWWGAAGAGGIIKSNVSSGAPVLSFENGYIGVSGSIVATTTTSSSYMVAPYLYGGGAANSVLNIGSTYGVGTTDAINFLTGSQVARWTIPNAGHFTPATPATYDLGDSTNTVNRIFRAGYEEVSEMTAPASPSANKVRIYAEDNGAGKTRLMALFATGAAQQIAIEP